MKNLLLARSAAMIGLVMLMVLGTIGCQLIDSETGDDFEAVVASELNPFETEDETTSRCEETEDGGWVCYWSDGEGTECTVVFSADETFVSQTCSYEDQTYVCEALDGEIECTWFDAGDALCSDVWTDEGSPVDLGCAEYYVGYSEEASPEMGSESCTHNEDTGDAVCHFEDDYQVCDFGLSPEWQVTFVSCVSRDGSASYLCELSEEDGFLYCTYSDLETSCEEILDGTGVVWTTCDFRDDPEEGVDDPEGEREGTGTYPEDDEGCPCGREDCPCEGEDCRGETTTDYYYGEEECYVDDSGNTVCHWDNGTGYCDYTYGPDGYIIELTCEDPTYDWTYTCEFQDDGLLHCINQQGDESCEDVIDRDMIVETTCDWDYGYYGYYGYDDYYDYYDYYDDYRDYYDYYDYYGYYDAECVDLDDGSVVCTYTIDGWACTETYDREGNFAAGECTAEGYRWACEPVEELISCELSYDEESLCYTVFEPYSGEIYEDTCEALFEEDY